ncbi:hypothetical protein [Dyadobacter frigoris]|uniref:Uncharacterized protein n=1 Tax=Dyadobacter frigoris TaxID=2576211 RepID=A0A4U6CZY4_9BACT|nr:hypothetical protein [Dyadobacter frigoris]TKT89505.1 hypothetical protein FDK13_24490 [Dyadobacter frigoris]
MSILESIHHFNSGSLITVKDGQLSTAWMVLDNKIKFLEVVLLNGMAAPGVQADLREYKIVKDEIARLMEQRRTKEHYTA